MPAGPASADRSNRQGERPDDERARDRGSAAGAIPVIEESVEVRKREVDAGGVRVTKTVETHPEVVDEALWRDELSVERRSADRAVTDEEPGAPYWQGDTLVVPVVQEVLVVSRQLRVTEEVLIHHRRTEYRAPQQVSLRRERVTVETLAPDRSSHHQRSQQETSMSTALIGVFETREAATKAYNELLGAGCPASDVALRTGDAGTTAGTTTTAYSDTNRVRDNEDSGSIGDWFRSLFGLSDEDEDTYVYDEALRRGHYLVTVSSVSDDRIDQISDILERCGSLDIEERATQWEKEGWARGGTRTASTATAAGATASTGAAGTATTGTATTGTATTGTATTGAAARTGEITGTGETKKIPVVEEELRVGKRVVGRGGVRVYTRLVEKPVEETVQLREERATVERRPADRPATEADLRALKEGSVEVRASAEEAVVSKQARVTEEIEVGKEVRDRTETVRDTVRHTDVQVEKTGDKSAAATDTTTTGTTTGKGGTTGSSRS